MVEYLLIAGVIVGLVFWLRPTLEARIGTSGQAGSLTDVLETQLTTPSTTADGWLYR